MKSVLLVAYFFPPEGNAGAFRPLRFARNLPGFGWIPTVLTLHTNSYERYDPGLLAHVPKDVEIMRVPNTDPWNRLLERRGRSMRNKVACESRDVVERIHAAQLKPWRSVARNRLRQAEAWGYHPDLAMGWIAPAVKAGLKLCLSKRAEVVWATAGPISSFVVAQRISNSSGIPYVLDFRDAWTLTYNEFEERRPDWARRADRRRLYRLLKSAQAVVFRYASEAESFWQAYRGVFDPAKTYIIPNGFDGAIERSDIPTGECCSILYSGTLSGYRYDTFLGALSRMRSSYPELSKFLRINFVGEGSEEVANQARVSGLSELVTTSGQTSQQEVVRLSREAQALLLLGRPSSMRGYELIAGAKLFGYLKAGRPIVGILPRDESRQTLVQVGVPTIADADSVDEIVCVLRDVVEHWSQGALFKLLPNRAACETYSAESQTRELARALSGEVTVNRFKPGNQEVPPSLRDEVSACREELSRVE